jgi:hypothetical protein
LPLLLDQRGVDEIVARLTTAELDQVFKIVGRSRRGYAPGAYAALKEQRERRSVQMSARPLQLKGAIRLLSCTSKNSPVGITPTPLVTTSAPEHLKALAGEIAVGGNVFNAESRRDCRSFPQEESAPRRRAREALRSRAGSAARHLPVPSAPGLRFWWSAAAIGVWPERRRPVPRRHV